MPLTSNDRSRVARASAGQADGGGESACTPDSVRDLAVRRRPSISAGDCPPAPAAYPGSDGRDHPPPARPCSGWGLPSHPGRPGCWCALTAPFHPYLCDGHTSEGRLVAIGGLLSVALSCGSPRLGVTQHPALWSPDVPRTDHHPKERVRTRPPGRLATAPIQSLAGVEGLGICPRRQRCDRDDQAVVQ